MSVVKLGGQKLSSIKGEHDPYQAKFRPYILLCFAGVTVNISSLQSMNCSDHSV